MNLYVRKCTNITGEKWNNYTEHKSKFRVNYYDILLSSIIILSYDYYSNNILLEIQTESTKFSSHILIVLIDQVHYTNTNKCSHLCYYV